ncbi:UNVERIFIED_CONTAM: 16S rRNA (cytosine967-C5)-methyltransferase [Acetivibrio alkalicellulosi]
MTYINIDIPRETVIKILYDVDKKGAYSNISLSKHLESNDFKDIDRAFITEMVYGTLKWRLTIDYIISQFSKIKVKKISPWILNILRMGIYQLIFTDKIPVSAACDESVKLAKRYGHAASSKYVNGVLRNVSRNKDSISYPDKNEDVKGYLSVKHSHPLWMVDQWVDRFGQDFTQELLECNNQVPPFSVRVNTIKISKEDAMKILTDEGLEVENGKYLDEALIIKNPRSVQRIDAFLKGYIQVQDESSMIVGRVLDPKPGEFIIDVCSAPGGKTTHIAQLMNNRGRVLARDIHEHKIELIDKTAKRLGIDIIETEVFDGNDFDEKLLGKADRVLVDAPCTGFGIIRRKPDIKWVRKKDDKEEIIKLQKKILFISSKYVKQGGVIVYSTCTIEPEENQNVVEEFLKMNDEFYLEDIKSIYKFDSKKFDTQLAEENLSNYKQSQNSQSTLQGLIETKNKYLQIYTNRHGIDGFFIARMRKRS